MEPSSFRYDAVAIVGPTACGKTKKAVSLAQSIDGDIISADSRQVYRRMDLGTGKDLSEYGGVGYHLIDICEPGEKYNLYRYIRDFHIALSEIHLSGKFPVVCGGSGLYVENALSGIRLPEVPENNLLRRELEKYSLEELTEILKGYKTLHNKTDVDNVKRAIRAIEIADYYQKNPELSELSEKKNVSPLNALIIGLDIARDKRRELISLRLTQRLKEGMLDEVKNLLDEGISPDSLIYYGLEYKFLTLHIIGKLTFQEMKEGLETAIHQFAKRQMTWFRGMERRGFQIHWLPYDMDGEEFNRTVTDLLNKE